MIYVLIMYCSGICPANLPPPSGVLLYTSLTDCEEHRALFYATKIIGPDGKPVTNVKMLETCSTVYAEPKQLDRLLDPQKLEQLLKSGGK
jgi:hypothetical protein